MTKIRFFQSPEGRFLHISGGTMAGNIDMNLNEITNLSAIRAHSTTDDIFFRDSAGNDRIGIYDLNSSSAFVLAPASTEVGYVGSSAHKWYRGYFSDLVDVGSLYIAGTEVIDSTRTIQSPLLQHRLQLQD